MPEDHSLHHHRHDHGPLIFPKGFLWGSATSAHQVEGNNVRSDWWEWEQRVQPVEKRSGEACNQYMLYEQDFKLAKKLGHKAHRLSLEWSRIEPEEGVFNQDEIDHYKRVLKTLKDLDFEVMLTLHHFTIPQWLAEKGGWEKAESVKYFARFVEKIVPEVKDYVDLWITINEPGIIAYEGYITCKFPPQKKNRWSAFKVLWNLAQAHKKAYKTIHKLTTQPKVGFTNNVTSFHTYHQHSPIENLIKIIYEYFNNHLIYLLTGKTSDFLGLNYYNHQYISLSGKAKLPLLVDVSEFKKDISDMGWEIHPDGIFDILVDFDNYKLPIYITENGIATDNDDRRVRFLLSYLENVYQAIKAGVDVRGYCYWSLLDNFEWSSGFEPEFGLIEVDRETQKRTVKPSAYVYKEICEKNGIPHYLLKLLGHTVNVEDVIKVPKE